MKPWQTARVREVRREGSEGVFVRGRAQREREEKKAAHRWRGTRESWRKVCTYLRKDPVTDWDRVKRASISGQDEMVDCVWTTSRKYLEWIGRASRPLGTTLLIMAVGAVGTSLNTERTLLIRRHVTAHPWRVNTLHSNDYSLFHTHTHTHKSCCYTRSLLYMNIHTDIQMSYTQNSDFFFFS